MLTSSPLMIAAAAAYIGTAGGSNKEGSGVGNHSAPKTKKAQSQANCMSYQAARPEKLPEEARENGFHYLDLKRIGTAVQPTDQNN
jgi:hypothetical protein